MKRQRKKAWELQSVHQDWERVREQSKNGGKFTKIQTFIRFKTEFHVIPCRLDQRQSDKGHRNVDGKLLLIFRMHLCHIRLTDHKKIRGGCTARTHAMRKHATRTDH